MAGSNTPALILLGHGARDPEWRRPIDAIWKLVCEQAPGVRVSVAFHEFIGPSLAEAVAALQAAGHREIVVVPVFIAQGGHLRQEIPMQIDALRRRYPDCRLILESAVGESPLVQAAIATHCTDRIRTKGEKN